MKATDYAFPLEGYSQGLSVRDFIAIKAMQGMLSGNDSGTDVVRRTIDEWTKHISKTAYLYADALIAESEKKNA